ncbi:hypothetical protein KPLM21_1300015 [Klebsiella pneumoniae]|nr:hypothetical protein KPLM21_1300015 [Klebsiella pneumoniae]
MRFLCATSGYGHNYPQHLYDLRGIIIAFSSFREGRPLYVFCRFQPFSVTEQQCRKTAHDIIRLWLVIIRNP